MYSDDVRAALYIQTSRAHAHDAEVPVSARPWMLPARLLAVPCVSSACGHTFTPA